MQPCRRLACLLWLCGTYIRLIQAQIDSVDLTLTVPGVILENSTFYGAPVFPIVARTFTTNASNFAVDWNIATQWTTRAAQTWDRSNRPFVLVHVAQYQALSANSVLDSPAEPNLLVAFTAHIVLAASFPSYKDRYDELLRQQLRKFSPRLQRRARLVALTVANNLLTERATDGSQDSVTIQPSTAGSIPGTTIGEFVPIGGANYQGRLIKFGTFGGSNYQFANATPFILEAPVEELPVLANDPGPPDLTSKFYDSNYKATLLLGEDNSTVRSRYQTDSAHFCAGITFLCNNGLMMAALLSDPNSFQTANTSGYHGQWNQITLASLPSSVTLSDTADLLAKLAAATYDTFIVVYNSKVRWQRWRPVTAIHAGDCYPGAPAYCHPAVPDWQPLLPTPNNPAYPSFIGGAAGAAEAIVNSFFNSTGVAFTIGSEAYSTTGRLEPRQFTSTTQAALECCNSRIAGGTELIPDALAGRDMGLAVGASVIANFSRLDPLSGGADAAYAELVDLVELRLSTAGI